MIFFPKRKLIVRSRSNVLAFRYFFIFERKVNVSHSKVEKLNEKNGVVLLFWHFLNYIFLDNKDNINIKGIIY